MRDVCVKSFPADAGKPKDNKGEQAAVPARRDSEGQSPHLAASSNDGDLAETG